MSTIKEDVIEIKTNLNNLVKSFSEFSDDQHNIIKSLTDRITTVEVNQSRQEERLSNFSIFQTSLSIVIGAIASFLGIRK